MQLYAAPGDFQQGVVGRWRFGDEQQRLLEVGLGGCAQQLDQGRSRDGAGFDTASLGVGHLP
jgi:hypothetical protein